MTSPISNLINAHARCVSCGAPASQGCTCWVSLHCTACGKTKVVSRDDAFPSNATRLEFVCQDCDPEGKQTDIACFDQNGKEIPFN